MDKGFWQNDLNKADLEGAIGLMERVLRKTISYFGFSKRETCLFKKVFCNRMLNFAYQASGKKKKGLPLYLFCLRNYLCLFTRPKLYLYPLRSAL